MRSKLRQYQVSYDSQTRTLAWGQGLPRLEPGQVLEVKDHSTGEVHKIKIIEEVV